MTLMLDPTQAADTVEAETQSLHAWSQEDAATEVVDYRPRSWKLPITLAITVLTAVIGFGAFLSWPEHSTTTAKSPTPASSAAKPQVAPIPAAQDPVSRYAALYRSRGGRIFPGHEAAAADEARNICREVAEKGSVGEEINGIMASSPGFNRYYASAITESAIDVFCPQYSGSNK